MTRSTDAADRFEHAVQLHGPRLMGYIARRVAVDESPDVAAQTLMTAWRRVPLMPKGEEEALWWLLSIARRTVANHRRGLVRRQALADRLREVQVIAAPAPSSEANEALTDALAALSENDQELVRLVYWDRLPVKGAAEVLGIGEATARQRLLRARSFLRRTIEAAQAGVLN